MANIDTGWDDSDFLEGDMDFDMDFDNPTSKKGFLRSLATGILAGVKDSTIGSTDNQIKTIRRILPSSFGTAFNTAERITAQTKNAVKEFKANSAEMMNDLAFLSGFAAKKLEGTLPNKIAQGLNSFSEKDFSDWAEPGESSDSIRMESTSDDDIQYLVADLMERNSQVQIESAQFIGTTINNAMSRSIGAVLATNQSLAGIDTTLKQIQHYQQHVQARNDAIKINLMSRMYLTNAKYYRFMEASMHRQIQELKEVVKYSQMSDYQKTTTIDAAKKSLRDSIFSTTLSRQGGFLGQMRNVFDKDRINGAISGMGGLVGDARMAAEFMDSVGGGGNVSESVGKLLGKILVEKGPGYLTTGKGRRLLDWFRKKYPKQAKEFDDFYKKATELGDTISYMSLAGVSTAQNHVAKNGELEKDTDTYASYLASLPSGARKQSRVEFEAMKTLRNSASGLTNMLNNASMDSTGSVYTLKQKTLKDLIEPAQWNVQSQRTLNEVIPRFLGMIAASNESIRIAVGGSQVSPLSYDFRNSKLVTSKQAKRDAVSSVISKKEFTGQASSTKSIIGTLGADKELSPKAQAALGMMMAQTSDKEGIFNPYEYIDLDSSKYMDSQSAKEISDFMRKRFGISQQDVDLANSPTTAGLAHRLTMPTAEGKSLAHEMALRTKSLQSFTPDLSNSIDLQIALGQEDALRETGLIQGKGANRSISKERLDDELYRTMLEEFGLSENDDKSNQGKGSSRNRKKSLLNRLFGGDAGKTADIGGHGNDYPTDAGIDPETLTRLVTSMEQSSKQFERMASSSGITVDMSKAEELLSSSNLLLTSIKDINLEQQDTLLKLLKRQPVQSKNEADLTPEEREEQRGKRTLMERIKSMSPRNLFNGSVEKLLGNQPLVLGGLLGGLAVTALHDPKAAMLLAGGAAAFGLYSKLSDMASAGDEPSDDEDIYLNPDDEDPILSAERLKRKDYYDSATKAVITSWKSIKNGVVDITGNVIATAKTLAGKLFGKGGRAVMLKGLNWVKTMVSKAFKAIDPVNRVKTLGRKIGGYFYQMDVYRIGDKDPTLFRTGFQRGEYYCKVNDEFKVINGWNEIEGAVYDAEQNILLSEEEVENGLVTSAGVKVTTAKNIIKSLGGSMLTGLGKFKDRFIKGSKKAYDKGKELVTADYTPITDRLDLIYSLLCQKFGIQGVTVPSGSPLSATARLLDGAIKIAEPETVRTQGEDGLVRTGSLEQKAQAKAQAKNEKVQDAIINISESLGGHTGEGKDKDKKSSGLWGILTKFLKAPFALAGGFFKMMMKGFPLLLSGIGLIGKGIVKTFGLMTSLVKLMLGRGGGAGDLGGVDGPDRNRRGRGGRGGRGAPRGKFGRIAGGLGKMGRGVGTAMAVGYGVDMLRDNLDIEEGGVADYALDAASLGANAYGAYSMVSGAAAMAGTSVTGLATAGASAVATGASATWAAAAPLLLSPVGLVALGVIAVGAIGYGIYSYYNRGKGTQYPLRILQYGFKDDDSDVAQRIRKLEADLAQYVLFSGGKASFAKDTPLNELFAPFMNNPNNPQEVSNLYNWFNYRFKPTYLIYMGALQQVKFKTLEEYDKSTEPRVYQVAKQVHRALLGWTPCPYDVTATIDTQYPTLNKASILPTIDEYFKDLEKYNERHGRKADGSADVEEPKVQTTKEQIKESEEAGFWKSAWMRLNGDYVTQEDQDELDAKFPIPDLVKEKNITDLLPGDGKPLDTLTAVRLAAYGNDRNIPWRVEAVLRLERYMESQVQMVGNDIRYIGNTSKIYNIFKGMFRIDSERDGNNWLGWFRDRFMPVFLIWYREVYNNRRGSPEKAWKSLSATTRANIANKFLDAKGTVKDELVTVWKIAVSPFSGSFSPWITDRKVKQWVEQLEYEANQAKLIDPKLEASRTSDQAVVKENEVKNIDGVNPGEANQRTADIANQLATDIAVATGRDPSSVAGVSSAPVAPNGGIANYKAIEYNVNTPIDDTGVRSLGDDAGVSVPRDTAIKYIIKEMTKQGFTDPRQIAEMLALCHYETGGFTKTAENMRYTDPTRAKSIFSRLSGMSVQEVAALIQQGPQAFANKVYGGWLGNTEPNDGWLYRGRGLVQLTGKDNYTKASRDLGIDLVSNPKLVSENPEVMAKTALWFFKNSRQLQSIKDNGDFYYAARGLNGGKALPGINDRYNLYKDYLSKLTEGKLNLDTGDAGSPVNPGAPGAPGGASADPTTGNDSVPIPGSDVANIQQRTEPKVFAPPSGLETNAYDSEMGPGQQFLPPSTTNANTGNAGADAFINTNTAMEQAGGSRSTNYQGLKLKSGEAVAGGPAHPGLIKLAQLIQAKVANFKYFSALNDAYHQKLPSNSSHKRGLALDFTLNNGVTGSDQAESTVTGMLRAAGMSDNEYLVINEYRRKTKYGNGGHIHVNFKTDSAAAKFLQASGGSATTGALTDAVQQTNGPSAIAAPTQTAEPKPDDQTAQGVNAFVQTTPTATPNNPPMDSGGPETQPPGTNTADKGLGGVGPGGGAAATQAAPSPIPTEVNVQAMKPETENAVLSQAAASVAMLAELKALNKNLEAANAAKSTKEMVRV